MNETKTKMGSGRAMDNGSRGHGSYEGYQYSVPITSDAGAKASLPVNSPVTVSPSESDSLLARYDIYEYGKQGDEGEGEDQGLVAFIGGKFFSCLGFQSNPFSIKTESGARNASGADLRLSMLSNLSTSYNILSISLSLHIMGNIYELTSKDSSVCSSALIAGMIGGQLTGGFLVCT